MKRSGVWELRQMLACGVFENDPQVERAVKSGLDSIYRAESKADPSVWDLTASLAETIRTMGEMAETAVMYDLLPPRKLEFSGPAHEFSQLVGVSLSLCLKDMLGGYLTARQVVRIFSNCSPRTGLDELRAGIIAGDVLDIVDQYSDLYWPKHLRTKATDLLVELQRGNRITWRKPDESGGYRLMGGGHWLDADSPIHIVQKLGPYFKHAGDDGFDLGSNPEPVDFNGRAVHFPHHAMTS